MFQPPLPEFLESMPEDEVHHLIEHAKTALGERCVILGHHYQRDEVIRHADLTGDSLKLARLAKEQASKAEHIVFCGVHFMAETADIVTPDWQGVSLPDLGAGCDMADMAEASDVALAWREAEAAGVGAIVPVTYVNSSAALKGFVGEKGGTICTSGNAEKIIRWALERGEHVFFFPDQHLGRNIAKRLGLDPERDMLLWDPAKPLGGHSASVIASTKIWLWKGHCPVHALFSVHQIKKIRQQSPETRIIVHPECAMEVVDLADGIGSTEQIIDAVKAAGPGSSLAIWTEKHLVERLASQFPDRRIVSLNPFTCLCATMNRISAKHLAWVMTDLAEGKPLRNPIKVPPHIAAPARLAIERMFELS